MVLMTDLKSLQSIEHLMRRVAKRKGSLTSAWLIAKMLEVLCMKALGWECRIVVAQNSSTSSRIALYQVS